jgi:hypothetical protein
MKGQEGGMLEFVGAYGKLILIGFILLVLLLMLFINYINSHPELGVKLPEIFGGGSSGGGGAGG